MFQKKVTAVNGGGMSFYNKIKILKELNKKSKKY